MKICNRQLRLFNKSKCSKYRCCNYITIFKENKETMRCFAKYIMCLSVACYIMLWMIATIILLAKTPPLTIRNKCPRSMLFTNSIFQILVTLIIAADQLYYYKYVSIIEEKFYNLQLNPTPVEQWLILQYSY